MLFCKCLAFTTGGHIPVENKLSVYFSNENTTQIFCHKIKGVHREIRKGRGEKSNDK